MHVHGFLLEGVAIGEIGHQVLSWRWLCCCCKDCNSVEGFFLLLVAFRLCASVIPLIIALLQRLEVIDISAISIYTLYLKNLGLPLSVWRLKQVDFQHLEDKCVGKLPT